MESRFDFAKLSRDKLYGRKRRIPLDRAGKACKRASIDLETGLILQSGMTGQGYFDHEDRWIPNKELVGLDDQLQEVERAPSTLGVAQDLRGPLNPQEVLDLCVDAIYRLEPQDLDDGLKAALAQGDTFGFGFNYRADYRTECGVLLENSDGYFALVGQFATPVWCEFEAIQAPSFDEDSAEDDDELDFEMF